MSFLVIKIGGSCFRSVASYRQIANHIFERYRKNKIIIVVSAMYLETDTLLKELSQEFKAPSKREVAALLSTAEQRSASRLAIALNHLGYPAKSLNAWQLNLKTNNHYEHYSVELNSLDLDALKKGLESNYIPVITGFQAIGIDKDIRLLERNGSDISAAFIAEKINAKACIFYTEVGGLYDIDPRISHSSQFISKISHEEFSVLLNHGMPLIHKKAAAILHRSSIPIYLKSLNSDRQTEVTQYSSANTQFLHICKNVVVYEFNQKDSPSALINNQIKNLIIEDAFYYKTDTNAYQNIRYQDRELLVVLDKEKLADEKIKSLSFLGIYTLMILCFPITTAEESFFDHYEIHQQEIFHLAIKDNTIHLLINPDDLEKITKKIMSFSPSQNTSSENQYAS